MRDRSNGYEGVAPEFLAGRGRAPSTAVGTKEVREWARTLRCAATVIDLGCGSDLPITKVLVSEGLNVYGIDGSPSLVKAFRQNLPDVLVACEAVEESLFFNRMFDGIVAWGLIFLLPPEAQRRLILRISDILVPGGRLLFTSCAGTKPLVWNDAMTGLESRSLGAAEYRRLLSDAGLWVTREYEDEGENHYFDASKGRPPMKRSFMRLTHPCETISGRVSQCLSCLGRMTGLLAYAKFRTARWLHSPQTVARDRLIVRIAPVRPPLVKVPLPA